MKNAIGMILAVVMAIACMCFVQAAAAEQTADGGRGAGRMGAP